MSLVTIARTASYRTVGTPQADGLRINGVSIDTEPNGGTAVDIDDPATKEIVAAPALQPDNPGQEAQIRRQVG